MSEEEQDGQPVKVKELTLDEQAGQHLTALANGSNDPVAMSFLIVHMVSFLKTAANDMKMLQESIDQLNGAVEELRDAFDGLESDDLEEERP